MKSAIGIGALLMDGLGDTIRVSLTEDPEYEMDPCRRLAQLGETACKEVSGAAWQGRECVGKQRLVGSPVGMHVMARSSIASLFVDTLFDSQCWVVFDYAGSCLATPFRFPLLAMYDVMFSTATFGSSGSKSRGCGSKRVHGALHLGAWQFSATAEYKLPRLLPWCWLAAGLGHHRLPGDHA